MTRAAITLLALLLAFVSCDTAERSPWVTSTYPADGAAGVPTNARIRVSFSEALDTASAESAFSVTPATAGSFEWAGDNSVMYWKPVQGFALQTSYTFAVETRTANLAGRRLNTRLSVGFTTGDDTAAFVTVAMLGRSVMSNWFSHWGGTPYFHDRFMIEHHEVLSPPDIALSARAVIDSLSSSAQPVVFFKLCFVDFVGGDSASAQGNLDRNFGYVEQVFEAMRSHELRMIVGNALPQLANATDRWLVWNHRQYNERLLALAAQRPDSLAVFDMYSVLADPNGNLKPAFASGPDDSHPNAAGYVALDSVFFPFLELHY